MDVKHVSDHLPVPGTFVLGARRGVTSHAAAVRLDVALERGLLLVVQGVAGGAQKDHHFVLLELRVVEHRLAVFGPEHGEVVQLPEAADGFYTYKNAFVMPAG